MSPNDDTLSTLTELVRKYVPQGRAIAPGDHIQADLGLDSLAVMELVCDVEARFEVTFPNATLDRVSTVKDVAEALVELRTVAKTG